MSEIQKLLDAATPLPWSHRPNHKPYHIVVFGGRAAHREGHTTADIERANAALIVHAVNSLPDYEAAVDALDWLESATTRYNAEVARAPINYSQEDAEHAFAKQLDAIENAREALRRLRPRAGGLA